MKRNRKGQSDRMLQFFLLLFILLPGSSLNNLVLGTSLFISTAYAQGVVEQYKPSGRYTPSGSVVEESAVLSKDVYTAAKAIPNNGGWVIREAKCTTLLPCEVVEKAYEPPKGYTLKAARSGEHGFGAAVYENQQTGQRTVAISGTGDRADAQTDVEIIARTRPQGGSSIAERLLDTKIPLLNLGHTLNPVREELKKEAYLDSQVKQSLAFFDEAQKMPPASSESRSQQLQVTGHSLGGGLAQIVGAKHHVETHTFNAVGVPEETIAKHVGTIRTSLPITNHIREHDLVGNFGKHIGTTITYPDAKQGGEPGVFATPSLSDAVGTGKNILQDHSMDSFINDLKFNDKMKGRVSTDWELEQKRAERAVQEPNSPMASKEMSNTNVVKRPPQDLGFVVPKKQAVMSNPLCPKE